MEQRRDYSLDVDCCHLEASDPGLLKLLVRYPQEVLPVFDTALNAYYAESVAEGGAGDAVPSLQARPHSHIPTFPQLRIPAFPALPPPTDVERAAGARVCVCRCGRSTWGVGGRCAT